MKLRSLLNLLFCSIGGVCFASEKPVVDIALGSADHTTLVAAVNAANLLETFNGPGILRVSAPTNAAFATIPPGTVNSLLLPGIKAKLVAILAHHVVPAKVFAAEVRSGEVPSVNGQVFTSNVDGRGVMINNAKVVAADEMVAIGVVDAVDTEIFS